jgi:hypothetical protein
MSDDLVRFAQRFIIRSPGHPDLHGVEFPSGRVIADHPTSGLIAAVSVDALCEGVDGAVVDRAIEEVPQ